MIDYSIQCSNILNSWLYPYPGKITMVVTTSSDCKSVIITGPIFYSWDYYILYVVKSTIIILYYIFLVAIAIIKVVASGKYKN